MAARRIIFLVYDGFELLDMAGAAGVFTTANAMAGGGIYDVVLASDGRSVRTSGGITLTTVTLARLALRGTDTVLVMGAYGKPLVRAMEVTAFHRRLRVAAGVCERIGSVCSGTFLLARAGLLDGRRATTHWAACERFRQMFPAVRLEPDALYVQDGDLWTSAGVTTGIDMALAMVGGDHGALLAAKVARQLVVYSHRPGHQSQFSSLLDAQTRATVEFAGLIDWVQARLEQPIRIAEMAAEMGMSERSFLRKFKEATGEPPSKYLDRLRIEKARVLLAAGASIKQTTLQVGFQSEAAFRSAFTARIGVSPSHYAKMQGARTV